jgi:glycerophosphoryl diester phosphodiesterase
MPTPPLLLGHRGARGQKSFAENTLAAFDFALAQGCDGFEFDVRLTADGEAVVCHDEKVRNLHVAGSTAEQLRLPLLRDVLSRYRRTAFLDIELKVAGLEMLTADLLRGFQPQRGFVVSSFIPEVLDSLHKIDSQMPLGIVCETQRQFSRRAALPIDYVILHRRLVRRRVVAEIHAHGKKLVVWTVNLPADIRRFVRWGVNGIVSDKPDEVVRSVRESVSRSPASGHDGKNWEQKP